MNHPSTCPPPSSPSAKKRAIISLSQPPCSQTSRKGWGSKSTKSIAPKPHYVGTLASYPLSHPRTRAVPPSRAPRSRSPPSPPTSPSPSAPGDSLPDSLPEAKGQGLFRVYLRCIWDPAKCPGAAAKYTLNKRTFCQGQIIFPPPPPGNLGPGGGRVGLVLLEERGARGPGGRGSRGGYPPPPP